MCFREKLTIKLFDKSGAEGVIASLPARLVRMIRLQDLTVTRHVRLL